MKRHRTILHISSLLAVLCAPAPAAAGPLLSGYGGPGAGAQTIIGATLLNGPRGGPGGNGSGGPSSSSSGGGPAGGLSSGGSSSTGSSSGDSRGGTRGHGGVGSKRSAGRAGTYSTTPHLGVSQAAESGSETSWFSETDLAAVLAAAVVLALTTAATMRLAGPRNEPDGGPG